MEYEISYHEKTAVINISGHFYPDFSTVFSQIVSEQLAAGYLSLVIDLKQVDILNSIGIKILVQAAEQAREEGGDLCLVNVRKNVYYILKLAGIHKFIRISPITMGASSSYPAERAPKNEAATLINFCRGFRHVAEKTNRPDFDMPRFQIV